MVFSNSMSVLEPLVSLIFELALKNWEFDKEGDISKEYVSNFQKLVKKKTVKFWKYQKFKCQHSSNSYQTNQHVYKDPNNQNVNKILENSYKFLTNSDQGLPILQCIWNFTHQNHYWSKCSKEYKRLKCLYDSFKFLPNLSKG